MKVAHVDARGVEPGDHRSLDHTCRARGVARDNHVAPLLQKRPVRLGRFQCEFRSDIDAYEALDSCVAEQ